MSEREQVKYMEAAIGVSKCSRNKKTFGIRFEKRRGHWVYNWAFPLSERSIKNEGYSDVKMSGGIAQDEEYPGCPYCKTKSFYVCQCGKFNCWDGEQRVVTCGWCGIRGELGASIDTVNLSGNI